MLEPVGQHAESQRLGAGDRLLAGLAVGQNAGEIWDFSDPAAVVFAVDFECEMHDRGAMRFVKSIARARVREGRTLAPSCSSGREGEARADLGRGERRIGDADRFESHTACEVRKYIGHGDASAADGRLAEANVWITDDAVVISHRERCMITCLTGRVPLTLELSCERPGQELTCVRPLAARQLQ
jgi:hypothetical protein